MKISASFLSITENIEKKLEELNNTNIDYLHLDIMDGKFVPNKTWDIADIEKLLKHHTKPLDVHLMVEDIYNYVDDFSKLNPEFITFHYEITNDHYLVIDYIKSFDIKVGISINPETDFSEIEHLLEYVDLILIMSVKPGMGGQKFIEKTYEKIKQAREKQIKYNYLIEVDGGINDTNISKIDADIIVVGSFITNSNNYQKQVDKLKN